MSLRSQILSSPETLSDLAWAAEQRYLEAEALLSAAHFSGAVYLLGLACEMWLKLACFRNRRVALSARVKDQLGPAKVWMAIRAPSYVAEGYHSLQFWAEYLVQLRAAAGAGLAGQLAGELRHHVVTRLHNDWKIEMRYQSVPISERHGWRVYNDATWVRQTWPSLWRF